ncbi:MAG: zf-HC2 domain-containing protein [Actinomycetota bacterium]
MTAVHTDIGAYSLGLLDDRDRQAFENHLASCPSCGAELAELTPMASLLSGIGPVPAAADQPPPAPQVVDLLSRRAAAQRRRSRWQLGVGAAAGIALLAGGGAAGVAVAAQSGKAPAPLVAIQGTPHSATDAGTGVKATVGLVSMGWGTQVTLDLAKVHGPLECELVAVSRTGEQQVILGWRVPPAGYGVPGHPDHLLLEGGTAILRSDLAKLVVKVVHGRTLVSIPV